MYSTTGPPSPYGKRFTKLDMAGKSKLEGKSGKKLFGNKNDTTNDERQRTRSIYIIITFIMLILCICSNSQSSSQFLTSIQSHSNFLTAHSLPYSWPFAIFYILFLSSMHVLYNCCPTFSYTAFTFLISSAVLEF
jgi:hypothetical protein